MAPLVAPLREPPLGGAEAIVTDLARGLAARGHEVDVYAATGSSAAGVSVVDVGVDWRALVESRYRAGVSPTPSAAARDAFARVFGAIRRRGYDAVHNHAFDAPAVELAVGSAPRVVHTLHLPPEPGLAAALGTMASRASSDERPLVVAVSAGQARSWRSSTWVDAVVRNGVPVAAIPFGPSPERVTVFAGRLSPEKGAREAIGIAREAGVPVEVYGDAYDELYAREEIEPLTRLPGVTARPALPRHQLWRRLSTAMAVLCPGVWDEPFGLVAAEAMAAGTPVVGFRSGGLVEIVREGVTGRLVEPGDVAGAARALRSAGELEREACRRHAEEELDLEAMVDAYEALYRDGGPRR